MERADKELNSVFQALSDGTRRQILMQLRGAEFAVSDISRRHNMSMPAITKHLDVLEHAGLITRQKVGRQRLCKASPEALNSVAGWLAHYQQFWSGRLDELKHLVEQQYQDDCPESIAKETKK